MAEENCEEIEGLPNPDLLAIAMGPKSMTADGHSYEERSVDELIALDRYIRTKQVACKGSTGWGNIIMHRAVPPGTT